MGTKKIAINGFGRIGRLITRVLLERIISKKLKAAIDISIINAAGSTGNMNPFDVYYALKYDSNYERFGNINSFFPTSYLYYTDDSVSVAGMFIKILGENDPLKIPWGGNEIDIVIDCTGEFVKIKEAEKHLQAGAKKVIVSAPFKKSEETELFPHIVMGVNETMYDRKKHTIISNASCTTHALASMVLPLEERFGIKKALMTTIHAYTGEQQLVDSKGKDNRRGRRAGGNIILTSTGAAGTIHHIIPTLKHKLAEYKKIDGIACRVDTPTGSVIDLNIELNKNPDSEEIIELYKEYSELRLKDVLTVAEDPIVSLDILKSPYSVIIDSRTIQFSQDENGNRLYKIFGWYDNEWTFSERLADLIEYVANTL